MFNNSNFILTDIVRNEQQLEAFLRSPEIEKSGSQPRKKAKRLLREMSDESIVSATIRALESFDMNSNPLAIIKFLKKKISKKATKETVLEAIKSAIKKPNSDARECIERSLVDKIIFKYKWSTHTDLTFEEINDIRDTIKTYKDLGEELGAVEKIIQDPIFKETWDSAFKTAFEFNHQNKLKILRELPLIETHALAAISFLKLLSQTTSLNDDSPDVLRQYEVLMGIAEEDPELFIVLKQNHYPDLLTASIQMFSALYTSEHYKEAYRLRVDLLDNSKTELSIQTLSGAIDALTPTDDVFDIDVFKRMFTADPEILGALGKGVESIDDGRLSEIAYEQQLCSSFTNQTITEPVLHSPFAEKKQDMFAALLAIIGPKHIATFVKTTIGTRQEIHDFSKNIRIVEQILATIPRINDEDRKQAIKRALPPHEVIHLDPSDTDDGSSVRVIMVKGLDNPIIRGNQKGYHKACAIQQAWSSANDRQNPAKLAIFENIHATMLHLEGLKSTSAWKRKIANWYNQVNPLNSRPA